MPYIVTDNRYNVVQCVSKFYPSCLTGTLMCSHWVCGQGSLEEQNKENEYILGLAVRLVQQWLSLNSEGGHPKAIQSISLDASAVSI